MFLRGNARIIVGYFFSAREYLLNDSSLFISKYARQMNTECSLVFFFSFQPEALKISENVIVHVSFIFYAGCSWVRVLLFQERERERE